MSVIAWINFLTLNLVTILCWWLYIRSVQPYNRAQRFGKSAWQTAKRDRSFSGILMCVLTVNMILWLWFPIPELAWLVHPNWLNSILIGIILAIIFTPIWFKGIKDAGRETMEPSPSTELYGGIYNYIRHPQAVGEMPWFVIIPLFLNSLFLVIWATIMILIVSPIIIYYEEKDLLERFGDKYQEYQQRTGAVFPKIRKQKK
ncbi:MAG: methyltransferase family protein [Promethearchaeota archaeon]